MDVENMDKEIFEEKKTLNSYSTSPRSSTRELIPLKIEGDANIKGCSDHFQNIQQIQEKRKHLLKEITILDSEMGNMLLMKGIYQQFGKAMQKFSSAIFNLDRNQQGVPYVANVKVVISKMYEEIRSKDVKDKLKLMCDLNVPFLEDLMLQFDYFFQLCESIMVTHINYHVTFLEDFHLVSGKLHGMMQAIITLLYGDQDEDGQTAYYTEEQEEPQEPKDQGLVKELQQLRQVFSNMNDLLGSIHRLSLGNPRIQSMRQIFDTIADVLADTAPLLEFYKHKVQCTDEIEAVILKMRKVASVKKPTEKHIEQLKWLLGESDGKVLIVTKYMSTSCTSD